MTDPSDTIRAWVDIDLGALATNAGTLAAACGARLLPMVKANGYGLGAAAVARALEPVNPWGFGVASPEEGIALQQAGIRRPILVTTPLAGAGVEPCASAGLRPSIGDVEALQAWCSRSAKPFHVEIDTGMGRSGLRWDDTTGLARAAELLAGAAGWEGVYTHFHSAEADPASVDCQWRRFEAALAVLPRRPPLVHAANSAAALRGPTYAADLVRPGIFLYGGEAGGVAPRPVAVLRARVVAVRRMAAGETVSYGATWRAPRPVTIATLGLGYADGFPRAAAVSGSPPRTVELGGRMVPVVGRVTMDMTMVAADDEPVTVGDVATIYGGRVSLDAQARAAGTISYELLTGLGSRVTRRYHE
jgi:alanine racemase